jgi:hypothetical protein
MLTFTFTLSCLARASVSVSVIQYNTIQYEIIRNNANVNECDWIRGS